MQDGVVRPPINFDCTILEDVVKYELHQNTKKTKERDGGKHDPTYLYVYVKRR